ncbi:MAG: type VI secretion system ImpA family N-terminal domain-containing protein [Pseudaminobacter sp.]|nr:type VI secretion system ImpA family N-terminal domain-containing protein [Pseudaminobacter sp.]
MRYDWLLEPIAELEPCGPDLDEVGDEKYLNYVLPSAGRIPERYYRADNDAPFDRNAIRIKNETDIIGELLGQTRDIRLLCIEARFQSFVGDLAGFSDAIVAIAGLVGRFWDDIHPRAVEGDFTLRQNVLSGLDDWWQIIHPLQHLPLVRDKRLDIISYRRFAVATGAAPARPDEIAIEASEIHRSLSAPENREASDLSFAAAVEAAKALVSIRESFIENSGYEYVPSFDKLEDFLGKVIGLFRAARPELAPIDPAISPSGSGNGEAGTPDGGEPPAAHAPPAAALKGLITNHAEASAALLAVEAYFAAREPSSPALILVHQARALVGKPFVFAIEALMPEAAARAVIKFQSGADFSIPMPLMKSLTDDVKMAANNGSATSDAEGGQGSKNGAFAANSRAEAMALMAEVEFFFKAEEPSSPIPMLLTKANGFTNRNFDMILKDLIGPTA